MTTCSVRNCERESLGSRRRGMCEGCYGKRREAGLYRMVEAGRVRVHVLDLVRRGWSHQAIGRASGIAHTAVGQVCDGRSERVRPETARRLLDVTGPPPTSRDRGRPVSSAGVWRRVQALSTMGWTRAEIAERAGLGPRSLEARPGGVTAETAAAVARVYDELCMTPGPSQTARERAAARGWAPPLAWDEARIDDPEAQPCLPEREADLVDEVAVARATSADRRPRGLNRAERAATVRAMSARGCTATRISEHLGISHADIRRVLTQPEPARDQGEDGLELSR